jgi:hypothetical protein
MGADPGGGKETPARHHWRFMDVHTRRREAGQRRPGQAGIGDSGEVSFSSA